jgi:hypothetical protein
MHDLIQDLQYGLRIFARNPTFTLIALLALALGLIRYLAALLYGVHTRDAWTFCSEALPALRATRVDPVNALRCE